MNREHSKTDNSSIGTAFDQEQRTKAGVEDNKSIETWSKSREQQQQQIKQQVHGPGKKDLQQRTGAGVQHSSRRENEQGNKPGAKVNT